MKARMPRMTHEDKKWRAQEDLRTLRVAQEISHDKARIRAAQSMAKQEMAALKRVATLKKSAGGKSSGKA